MVFNASDLLPKSSGKPSGKSTDQNNISEDWTKFGKRQILSIGSRKKQHHNINNHDINEDDDIDVNNGYNSSSDEEEGRTSAVREKKRKVVFPAPTQPSPPVVGMDHSTSLNDINVAPTSAAKKKKKKKGKKERAKETNAETVAEEQASKDITTTDEPKDVAKEVEQGDDTITKDNTSDGDTKNININNSNVVTTNTKRKRKKVRSRQKNIRKDNRTKEDKPSHLVVGSGVDYAGRPMTKETRIKLGLESTTTNKKHGKGVNGTATMDVGEMFDSGEWVGGDNDNATAETDKDVAEEDCGQCEGESKQQTRINVGETISLTKIGDCIVGNDVPTTKVTDVGGSLNDQDIKKKGKKQKKRKFKNLVVG